MGRIVVTEFMSLDGVMEAPEEWSFPFQTDETAKLKHDELFASDALLLGKVTYDIFASSWPMRTGDFADRMNSIPKYVVTKLDRLEWNNSRQLKGELAAVVADLKAHIERDILVAGSGALARTLTEHGLVDLYRLLIHPLVLGEGKHLFNDTSHLSLKLVTTKTYSTGIVLLEYAPQNN
jgi:dihydrofolate reductase